MLVLAAPTGAQPTCPDYRFISGCTAHQSRAAAADSIDCPAASGRHCHTAYDWREGYYAFDEIGFGTAVYLEGNDSLRIVGLAAGTPVTFRLHARTQCGVDATPALPTAGFEWEISFGVTAGGGLLESGIVNPGEPAVAYDHEQDLLVTRPAGQTFCLRTIWRGGGGANTRVWMRATLEILDLPPGARLLSCRGFGDVPTRVRPRTWGALKVDYR